MARYFYTNSAARPVKFGAVTFRFTPVSMTAGRMAGVYEATNEGEITLLTNAVHQRLGVSEITQEQFDHSKKKQLRTKPSKGSSLLESRIHQPPVLPNLSVANKAGVASAAGSAPSAAQAAEVLPLPKVTSLMKLGRVNSPNPMVAEGARIKKLDFGGKFPEPSSAAKKARAKVARGAVA